MRTEAIQINRIPYPSPGLFAGILANNVNTVAI